MPTVRHTFAIYIYYPDGKEWGGRSNGLEAQSTGDVEEFGVVIDVQCREAGYAGRLLDVNLDENDPRLQKLYEAIYAKYQLRPSHWNTIPVAERVRYFGVKRKVTWTEQEIDTAELLRLHSSTMIAEQEDADEEQLAREEYVALLDNKQNSKVQLGFLSPFNARAVAEPLRSHLLAAGLDALYLPPVVFAGRGKVKKPLWTLKSHVILPPTLNPLLNGQGEVVPPNTQWWSFWDDGGHVPPTLRYQRDAVAALPPFDIAMTCERVGPASKAAFRECIVTQKFRAELKRLKVPGLSYVPVVLE